MPTNLVLKRSHGVKTSEWIGWCMPGTSSFADASRFRLSCSARAQSTSYTSLFSFSSLLHLVICFPLAFLQTEQRNSEAWPPHGVCPGHDKPWWNWGRPHKFTTNFRVETTNTWHCRPGEETGANGRECGSDTPNYENCGWSSSERKSKKSALCFQHISF